MTFSWQILQQFITRHNLSEKPLVVALSGGADSVALLVLFHQLREETGQKFSAVHINHGLSLNAQTWQQLVITLCRQLNIELSTYEIQIADQGKASLEQKAREGRYQEIASHLTPNSILFTGHHQVDQVETFFLRLMRSSGLTGLTSMKSLDRYPLAVHGDKNLRIARPLLMADKSDIVNFLKEQSIHWVEDESNQDDRFDRNFIRNNIIPLFKERWPKVSQSVANSVEVLQSEAQLLEEYIHQDYLVCLGNGFLQQPVLNIEALKKFKVNKQAVIVRRFIQLNSDDVPSRAVLNELLDKLIFAADDAQPELRVGDKWLKIHKQQLYLVSQALIENSKLDTVVIEPVSTESSKHSSSQNSSSTFTSSNTILPPSAIYSDLKLECDNCSDHSFNFSIRWGNSSDKLKPNRNSGSKKVKDLLKELGCPVWLRDKVPLIYDGEKLVAVANFYIDVEYQKLNLSISALTFRGDHIGQR